MPPCDTLRLVSPLFVIELVQTNVVVQYRNNSAATVIVVRSPCMNIHRASQQSKFDAQQRGICNEEPTKYPSQPYCRYAGGSVEPGVDIGPR